MTYRTTFFAVVTSVSLIGPGRGEDGTRSCIAGTNAGMQVFVVAKGKLRGSGTILFLFVILWY